MDLKIVPGNPGKNGDLQPVSKNFPFSPFYELSRLPVLNISPRPTQDIVFYRAVP